MVIDDAIALEIISSRDGAAIKALKAYGVEVDDLDTDS